MSEEGISKASPHEAKASGELAKRVFRLLSRESERVCWGALTFIIVYACHQANPADPDAALERYVESLRKSLKGSAVTHTGPLN